MKNKRMKMMLLCIVALFMFCACSADNISSETIEISSEEEILLMISEAADNKDYDMKKFLNVNSEKLDQLLQATMVEIIPEKIEIDYFTDYNWNKTLRYIEIAEASGMPEEQKALYINYRTLVNEALVLFSEVEEIYESYAGATLPSEDYKKFELGKKEMQVIKANYDSSWYSDFYVRNALKNSTIGKIVDAVTGNSDLNYYYANDVVDAGFLGEWWGDEHYCIAIKDTFPESGVYTLYGYYSESVELENDNGFVVDAQVYVVISQEESNLFNELYFSCLDKEEQIYNKLKEAKTLICGSPSVKILDTAIPKDTITTGYEDRFTGEYKDEYEDIGIAITSSAAGKYYLTYITPEVILKDIPNAYTTNDGNGLMFWLNDYYPEYEGYLEITINEYTGYNYNTIIENLAGTDGDYWSLIKVK